MGIAHHYYYILNFLHLQAILAYLSQKKNSF